MTDTLTALEAARKFAINEIASASDPSEQWLTEAANTLNKCDAAIASLTAPFSPETDLEGWVKEKKRWALRIPEPEGIQFPDGSTGNDEWFLAHPYLADAKTEDTATWHLSHRGMIVYRGPLPTASFFHALCGALNIK